LIIWLLDLEKVEDKEAVVTAAGVRSASTDKQAPEEEWDKPVSINTFGFEP